MHGINPQGCRVHSFKAPNDEELQHHFLWRPMRFLPARGMVTIFNRSYYEEVMVVRVHPEFLHPQKLPPMKKLGDLWKQRYEEIRTFEETLVASGTSVLKFFLHVSKEEQKSRLMERLVDPNKRWKFNERDLDERQLWSEHQTAYEEALAATSTKKAPWFVIPADDKWYARAAIADIIVGHVESLGLNYPKVPKSQEPHYAQLIERLENEK
jgi:PPK2 family polyphosphate:nucleotide phosphotransferase